MGWKVGVTVTYTNYVEELEGNATRRQPLAGAGRAWERYINEACEDHKLRVYIFNLDTLKKYDWKTIIENKYYSKEMEFTTDDLEKQNWEIQVE